MRKHLANAVAAFASLVLRIPDQIGECIACGIRTSIGV